MVISVGLVQAKMELFIAVGTKQLFNFRSEGILSCKHLSLHFEMGIQQISGIVFMLITFSAHSLL